MQYIVANNRLSMSFGRLNFLISFKWFESSGHKSEVAEWVHRYYLVWPLVAIIWYGHL